MHPIRAEANKKSAGAEPVLNVFRRHHYMTEDETLAQLQAQRVYIMRELKAGRLKYNMAMPVRRALDKKILKTQRELRK